MLYRIEWDRPKVADVFSLESLIAWLEKQPTDGRYCYINNGRCLLSQYFRAMGFQRVRMLPWKFDHSDGEARLPEIFDQIAQGHDPGDWVFGAALARARHKHHDWRVR